MMEFCEQILKAMEYSEPRQVRIVYHPQFTKKIVYDYPSGARASSPVHWNYELQNDDRPGSRLICYDKNDNEVPCDYDSSNEDEKVEVDVFLNQTNI